MPQGRERQDAAQSAVQRDALVEGNHVPQYRPPASDSAGVSPGETCSERWSGNRRDGSKHTEALHSVTNQQAPYACLYSCATTVLAEWAHLSRVVVRRDTGINSRAADACAAICTGSREDLARLRATVNESVCIHVAIYPFLRAYLRCELSHARAGVIPNLQNGASWGNAALKVHISPE